MAVGMAHDGVKECLVRLDVAIKGALAQSQCGGDVCNLADPIAREMKMFVAAR
jgi:hypothetical protein